MRLLAWLVRAAVFFALFAFALNNLHEVAVRWFFGQEWRAPMVFVVLAAFAFGCAFGIFAMVPSWWRHRRVAMTHKPPPLEAAPPSTPLGSLEPALQQPPRDGL
jgi:uncharacterized integral membrane protein